MTGNRIIREAKLLYPVELALDANILVSLLNQSRERVNRLLNLSYTEHILQTVANQRDYILTTNFYRIYRANIEQNNILRELDYLLEGQYPFTQADGMPRAFAFRPMNQLYLYPIPNAVYNVYLYGNRTLTFNYTINNLDTTDTIPSYLLPAVATELARRLAGYDQQYELTTFLESQFLSQLREMKP